MSDEKLTCAASAPSGPSADPGTDAGSGGPRSEAAETEADRWRAAAEILAKGGRLVIAKNVSLPVAVAVGEDALPLHVPFGVVVEVCEWLPPDTVLAVASSLPLHDQAQGVRGGALDLDRLRRPLRANVERERQQCRSSRSPSGDAQGKGTR